jgi:hypothetical protein
VITGLPEQHYEFGTQLMLHLLSDNRFLRNLSASHSAGYKQEDCAFGEQLIFPCNAQNSVIVWAGERQVQACDELIYEGAIVKPCVKIQN